MVQTVTLYIVRGIFMSNPFFLPNISTPSVRPDPRDIQPPRSPCRHSLRLLYPVAYMASSSPPRPYATSS